MNCIAIFHQQFPPVTFECAETLMTSLAPRLSPPDVDDSCIHLVLGCDETLGLMRQTNDKRKVNCPGT